MNEKIVSLSEICQIVDCPHSSPKWMTDGIPVIRNFNLVDGTIDDSNLSYVTVEEYKNRTKRIVPKENDILFSREAPIGNVAIIPKNFKCCQGQRIVLLRPETVKVIPQYLLLALSSNFVKQQINAAEQKMSAEEVYKQNTPYRILRFVIPKVEQETIFSTLRENRRIINEFENLHRVPLYCPACIEEDIKVTGSAWQHIYHNCGNVKACCKHHCRLVPGIDAARNAQIETADEEMIAYAEWLYKLFRIEGVDACREKTSKLAFKTLSERFPDVYNNKSSGDLRILQAAYNRFKSYTLRDADFLRLTFLLWNDRFDEFCEKYPR